MTHYEFIRAMGVLAIFCLLFSAAAPTVAMIIGMALAGVLVVFEVVQVGLINNQNNCKNGTDRN